MVAWFAAAAAVPGVDAQVLRPLVLLPCLVPPRVPAMALFSLGTVLQLLGLGLGLGLQVAAVDMGPAQGMELALGFALESFCSGQAGG